MPCAFVARFVSDSLTIGRCLYEPLVRVNTSSSYLNRNIAAEKKLYRYRYRQKSVSLFVVKKARRRKLLDPVELGRRRWKGVGKEERTAIARKAVLARWDKARQTASAAGKGDTNDRDGGGQE